MEFVLIGIISALNLIIILHKFKRGRIENGIFDIVLFGVLVTIFNGTYAGMVVGMVASLVISAYLWCCPPTFFGCLRQVLRK